MPLLLVLSLLASEVNLLPLVGPLTEAEQSLQGIWRGGYTIVIEGREFCADTQPGEWYEGYVAIRDDVEPAEIDFIIVMQSGGPNGNASKGFYRWEDETLIILSSVPGTPRPETFVLDRDEPMVELHMRLDGEASNPATHCLGE